MGLSKQQRAFIEHYLQCFNATEAARLAKYSERTARQQGSRLLSNVDILAAIETRLSELKMQSDEVLVRLAAQARGSMADFVRVNDRGEVSINLKAAQAKNSLHLVKKVRKTVKRGKIEETTVEIELYDAQAALGHLARIHGLYQDKLQVDWRVELQEAGLDPDAVESELVAQFERHIRDGAERLARGGAEEGTGTGTSTATD